MTSVRLQDLVRISEYEWEIPRTFRSDMRVPVRIFATRRLLEAVMGDKSLEQAINAATLPGVVGRVVVMPDVHQGYGFPIGGVAATRFPDGVISPGAIGYDINCLAGDTPILHPWGYTRPIAAFASDWEQQTIVAFNLRTPRVETTPIERFWKRPLREGEQVYRLRTAGGASIFATEDHPFWTPNGMVKARDLREGDLIARYPLEGVPYEPLGEQLVLSEERFAGFLRRANWPRADIGPAIERLKAKGLLPLQSDHERCPRLARVVGFLLAAFYTGRVVYQRGQGARLVQLPAESVPLLLEDLRVLHIQAQQEDESTVFLPKSEELLYLSNLGAPLDDPTHVTAAVPKWVRQAPRWIQRLFLGGFFALTLPNIDPERAGRLFRTMTWIAPFAGASTIQVIFHQIASMLAEFGIQANILAPELPEGPGERAGIRVGLALAEDIGTQRALWQRVGVQYRPNFLRKAWLTLHYWLLQREALPQVPRDWEAFRAWATQGLADSGMVWDVIVQKTAVPFEDDVYDFTVAHPDHNFVAATFVVSNCGVRLLATRLPYTLAEDYLDDLASAIDYYCPSGVGRDGHIRLSKQELDEVAREGARWALKRGYATPEDLRRTEEGGRLAGADPSKVSKRAKERGRTQLGTVGAGNHFIEVDVIEQIYDLEAAEAMGLEEGMLAVQIHCGSRGFGHQICSDYVRDFQAVVRKYNIRLPDRELVCAPLNSPEGRDYLAAMNAAANFAFANRQVLAHFVRKAFEEVFAGLVPQDQWYPRQVYDLAHNIGKVEVHTVNGKRMKVMVHRKGATRAFGPGAPGLPPEYREIGQPVLVPGSMGTASWVLVGTETSMRKSFGSSCHGAGRVMSRAKAKKAVRGEVLQRQLEGEGIRVRAGSMRGLAEEAPFAYKDVDEVVETVVGAGLARKVARLRPVAVIKG
ncbi:MAG: RNA-splicing ligase RtcB [Chloroflexi bacterium]|nr:RNA-splicing ligase RtcB [Chloroflexota bacterium]